VKHIDKARMMAKARLDRRRDSSLVFSEAPLWCRTIFLNDEEEGEKQTISEDPSRTWIMGKRGRLASEAQLKFETIFLDGTK
jgi:hypothetical protein